jgi:hypothetical protein
MGKLPAPNLQLLDPFSGCGAAPVAARATSMYAVVLCENSSIEAADAEIFGAAIKPRTKFSANAFSSRHR